MTMLMASQRRGRARHEGCGKRLTLALAKDAGRRRTRVVWLACLVLGRAGAAMAEEHPKDALATILRQNG